MTSPASRPPQPRVHAPRKLASQAARFSSYIALHSRRSSALTMAQRWERFRLLVARSEPGPGQ
ncbi:MAG: hypothetical protein M0R74_06320 [Dehalococcoidia bacterium]|nr:hypothetical protein [Dehalococcoidia bacterium]